MEDNRLALCDLRDLILFEFPRQMAAAREPLIAELSKSTNIPKTSYEDDAIERIDSFKQLIAKIEQVLEKIAFDGRNIAKAAAIQLQTANSRQAELELRLVHQSERIEDLEQHIAELESEKELLEQKNRDQDSDLDRLLAENARIQEELDAYRKSTSNTTPLRTGTAESAFMSEDAFPINQAIPSADNIEQQTTPSVCEDDQLLQRVAEAVKEKERAEEERDAVAILAESRIAQYEQDWQIVAKFLMEHFRGGDVISLARQLSKPSLMAFTSELRRRNVDTARTSDLG